MSCFGYPEPQRIQTRLKSQKQDFEPFRQIRGSAISKHSRPPLDRKLLSEGNTRISSLPKVVLTDIRADGLSNSG